MGAIANEGGIDSEFIGRINIFDTFSTVDLPEGMPREIIRSLKKIRVAGRALNFSKWDASPDFVKMRKRGPASFPRSKSRARHARKKR